MIEKIGDLIKLLHRYPSTTRITIGYDEGMAAQLSGDVMNSAVDEIILILAPLPDESPPKKEKPAGLSDDSLEAIDQCDRILTLCDDVPERAEDFATEIMKKVQSVRDWVEKHDHVTPNQSAALDGWERGISKWVDRE